MTRTAAQKAALEAEIAAVPAWYHAIDLGDGIWTPGALDMRAYLHHYPLPERMDGMRVLDVGASNGFFAAEFERRGASEVVALDLPSWAAHDWTPRQRRHLERYSSAEKAEFDHKVMRRGFDLVMRELGCRRVEKLELSIYDVSPERLGTFDLVFSGSMLMHARDPLLGLHAMRSVCGRGGGGELVISVSTTHVDSPEPVALFAGEWELCNYWRMSPACLERALRCADFEPVGERVVYEQAARGGESSDQILVRRAVPAHPGE